MKEMRLAGSSLNEIQETPARRQPWSRRVTVQILFLALIGLAGGYSRTTLGPVQEAMQRSLGFSDQKIALLQGLALAVPIAILAAPLGILADRVSRVKLLFFGLVGVITASVATAFSTSFTELLLARILLGASFPVFPVVIYAMASDIVDETSRGRAATWLSIGEQCGAPAAFMAGGVLLVSSQTHFGNLSTLEPWGATLLIMSALLLPFMLCLKFIDDPRENVDIEPKNAVEARISGKDSIKRLWAFRAVAVPLQIIRATLFIADGAVYVWGAPLFIRKYNLPPDKVGLIIGVVLLICGIVAAKIGGTVVDYFYARSGPRGVVKALTLGALFCIPVSLYALASSPTLAAILLALFLIGGLSIATGALALTTIVIPSDIRGLNIGISLLVGSLFFVGLSPLAVSFASDRLGGPSHIDEALAIVCGVASLLNALVLLLSINSFSGVSADEGSPIESGQKP